MANILGTSLDDFLLGDLDPLLPNDVLNSSWFGGDDTMVGGNGDDTYNVNSTGDLVTEGNGASSGIDTVRSQLASYTLTSNVENLTLQDQDRSGTLVGGLPVVLISLGAPTAVTGTGNTLANTITGNSNANTLNGMAGADTLLGGDGNDTLNGGTEGDTLNGDAGNDTLNGDGGNDTLDGGADNDSLTGGTGNDSLLGGSGADTMTGSGGNDTMTGGTGNDRYYVDDIGDVTVEAAASGTDTVYASISDTLDVNVENLTLTGTAATGTGNGSNNLIIGNASANLLTGNGGNDTLRGGAGNDTELIGSGGNDELNGEGGLDLLTGGTGLDRFVFTSSGALNADTISDFVAADDTIVLGNALDAGMAGALSPGLKGLAFIGGNVVGNTLSAAWYFEGVGMNGSGAGLSGIYVDTLTGDINYDPTSGIVGDNVLLGRVDFAIASTLSNTDFVLG